MDHCGVILWKSQILKHDIDLQFLMLWRISFHAQSKVKRKWQTDTEPNFEIAAGAKCNSSSSDSNQHNGTYKVNESADALAGGTLQATIPGTVCYLPSLSLTYLRETLF